MKIQARIVLIGIVSVICTLGVSAVQPVAAAPARGKYAALGDSIAAGAGLSPLPGATAEDTYCGRSVQAYPQLLAASHDMPVATNAACGNAKASNLYEEQVINGTRLKPQIDAAFAQGKPELITLTVGANDLNWADLIGKCYTSSCGSAEDSARTAAARLGLRAKLAGAYFKIAYMSGFTSIPKVLVTGYFEPFSGRQCGDTQGVTAEEMNWVNNQAKLLNETLSSTTQWFGFTSFVPVSFAGHELCSQNPWVQGQTEPAPFHPTASGQQAIAESIKQHMIH